MTSLRLLVAGLTVIVFLVIDQASCRSLAFEKLSEIEKEKANNALYGNADMVFTSKQRAAMKTRSAMENFSQRWSKGILPYAFDDDPATAVSDEDKKLVADAAAHINEMTGGCIHVKPRTNESDYVLIKHGEGCNSYLGRTSIGAQPLNLGDGCGYFGTVVHELMHALGFNHEHQRADRDTRVQIDLANVQDDFKFAFDVIPTGHVYTDFDFNSIMLYGPKAFSKNGQVTIVAKNGESFDDPYDKSTMSRSDVKQIVEFYKEECNNYVPDGGNSGDNSGVYNSGDYYYSGSGDYYGGSGDYYGGSGDYYGGSGDYYYNGSGDYYYSGSGDYYYSGSGDYYSGNGVSS